MKCRIRAIGMFDFGGMVALMSPLISYRPGDDLHHSTRLTNRLLVSLCFRSIQLVYGRCLLPTAKLQHEASARWQNKMADVQAAGLRWHGSVLYRLHPVSRRGKLGWPAIQLGVRAGHRNNRDWDPAACRAWSVRGIRGSGISNAPTEVFKNIRGFTMLLVVCFVGGMLYYSMNVLWPRQSTLLFVPADRPIIAGVYANMVRPLLDPSAICGSN